MLITHHIVTLVKRKQTFVVVIPKKGWARVAVPVLLLVGH